MHRMNEVFVDKRFQPGDVYEFIPNIKWKRPHEITTQPCIKSASGPSAGFQGAFENCWLISATAALQSKICWEQVFGNSNILDSSDGQYTGKICIHLWQYNKWNSVTIDDRLPVVESSNKNSYTLVGASCEISNEFWAPLLEKACAKYFGSYSCLTSGQVSNGFLLFTGALCYKQFLRPDNAKDSNKLFEKIRFMLSKNCLIFASMNNIVEESDVSIKNNHYYAIKNASDEICNVVELSTTYKDFKTTNYSVTNLYENNAEITYCFDNLQQIFPTCISSKYYCKVLYGSWNALTTSGGGPSCPTYYKNPKYIINFLLPNNRPQIMYIELTQKINCTTLFANQAINIHIQIKNGTTSKTVSYEAGYAFSKTITVLLPMVATDCNDFLVTIIPSSFESHINESFMMRLFSTLNFETKNSEDEEYD